MKGAYETCQDLPLSDSVLLPGETLKPMRGSAVNRLALRIHSTAWQCSLQARATYPLHCVAVRSTGSHYDY